MNMIKSVLEIVHYLTNATTKSLKVLRATLNFIDIWLKLFADNYDTRCAEYINAMK